MYLLPQSRAQSLIKQFQDLADEIDKAHMELSTFKLLQQQEESAIPKRIEVCPLFSHSY